MVAGIFVISLTYALQTYITFDVNTQQLTNSVALKNEALATNLIQRVDIFVDKRIDDFRSLAKTREIRQILELSNEEFSRIKDIELFMEQKENIRSENFNRYLPFVTQAVERKYSEDLNSIITSYSQEYGYNLVDEFFITNAYGANVVLVYGTAGYVQFDKEWWHKTKEDGLHMGKLEFQEKYNSYSLPLGIKITKEDGSFLGTIRVLIGIEDLLSEFSNNANLLAEENKKIVLVDNNGTIIYSDGIVYESGTKLQYFDELNGNEGHLTRELSGDSTVVSYSKSAGYEDFPGLGWTVLVEQKKSDIIADIEGVRESILIPSLIGVFITIAIGVVISFFVSKPMNKLTSLVTKIARGEFSVRAQESKIQEINVISKAINEMTTSLKKLVETEKELAETRVKVRNERLTAIGELSASMAHDMKNPLAILKTSSDILKRKFGGQDEKIDQLLSNMDKGISRMSHQIKDVLDYVRITPVNVADYSLKDIINSAVSSIEIPDTISVEIPEKDITIQCDKRKLEVVFINLILNAIQAIGQNSGNIKFSVSDTQDDFVIEVQNTGEPIPREIIDKIFDPLFSTKHQGTGLGLSTCKNVIEQHGGKIQANNHPTRFTIFFPKHVKTVP